MSKRYLVTATFLIECPNEENPDNICLDLDNEDGVRFFVVGEQLDELAATIISHSTTNVEVAE